MVDLPFHAVPVIVEDQVRLRVYGGSNLKIEIPLRQRQALVLAAQILNVTLAADHGSAPQSRRARDGEREAGCTEGERSHA